VSAQPTTDTFVDDRKHRRAFFVLCLGALMIFVDGTVVNVALPSIKRDLGFSDASLAWVVNAYLLTFASFLMLGGRLGDLCGHTRLFHLGMAVFTLASLGCGLAATRGMLIAARAVQGLSSAAVSPVAFTITMKLFPSAPEFARAMGIYSFVNVGAYSLGLLVGGMLTTTLNWHWIFLANVPLGIVVCLYGYAWLPSDSGSRKTGRLDVGGVVLMTSALALFNYATNDANQVGWTSGRTLTLCGAAAILFSLFLRLEARARDPLIPLYLFRKRNLVIANIVSALLAAATLVWYFISTLYMQLVLGYTPLEAGLAFLPTTAISAAFSLSISAKLISRFELRSLIAIGLLVVVTALILFTRTPVGATFATDMLPGMVLLGIGSGMISAPILLTAMNGAAQSESGLVSGVVNTSTLLGGSLGLAILTSVAAARDRQLRAAGAGILDSLNSGYHFALAGAALAVGGAFLGVTLLRLRKDKPPPEHEPGDAAVSNTECGD
jgi:EmrB/QacA subfamily drug resistance transporter